MSRSDNIIKSLRRIIRAIDVHSRHLSSAYALTVPQLVCLRQLAEIGPQCPSKLAKEISLSQPTVTGIVDRLERRGMVERRRDQKDRRQVTIHITPEGYQAVLEAPQPLQERFAVRLAELPEDRQKDIEDALRQVAEMMDKEHGGRAGAKASPRSIQEGKVPDKGLMLLEADHDIHI